MSATEALRATLLANATIAGIVADRISHGRAPQLWHPPYGVLWLTRIESQGVVSGVQVFKRFYQVLFVMDQYQHAIAVEEALLSQIDRSEHVTEGARWQWTLEELGESMSPVGEGDEAALLLVEATIGAMPT